MKWTLLKNLIWSHDRWTNSHSTSLMESGSIGAGSLFWLWWNERNMAIKGSLYVLLHSVDISQLLLSEHLVIHVELVKEFRSSIFTALIFGTATDATQFHLLQGSKGLLILSAWWPSWSHEIVGPPLRGWWSEARSGPAAGQISTRWRLGVVTNERGHLQHRIVAY